MTKKKEPRRIINRKTTWKKYQPNIVGAKREEHENYKERRQNEITQQQQKKMRCVYQLFEQKHTNTAEKSRKKNINEQ